MVDIKANKIAGGGIMSAICIVLLLGAAYVPNLMLAFLFASSITVGICILRYKTACALISYVSASVISFFIVPDISLMFIILFGIYPVIKLYIEKIRKLYLEYLLKFFVWNIVIILAIIVVEALGIIQVLDMSRWVVWIVGICLLVFYDFMFTVVINAFYKSYYKYLK